MVKIVGDFLYEKEPYDIRGACFDIWKQFKGMFKESIINFSPTKLIIKPVVYDSARSSTSATNPRTNQR